MHSENNTVEIFIVYANDWQALYINGKLEYENRKVPHTIISKALKDHLDKQLIAYNIKWCTEIFQERVENGEWSGGFPLNLSDVELEDHQPA